MTKIKCGGCGGDYYTTTEQCDTDGCSWTQYDQKENNTFNNVKEFENYLHKKAEYFPDIVEIENIVFTMDQYDMEGKELSYGNKRTLKGFTVETSNRYKNGIKDSKVGEIEETCIRNDMSYQD